MSKAKKKDKKNTTSIGGQALMEGVMMRGASSMAMAVRAPDGEILVEATRLPTKKRWYMKVPILRGAVAFISTMISGVSTLMKSASVSSPEEEMPGKVGMTIAVILGVVFAVGIFIILPSLINSLLIDHLLKINNILISSLVEGLIRIIIFVLYLLIMSKIKDIRRTFMYHGAEHRTINCFENGYEMTVENVQKCSTRHNRCGTTFLFFVMIISILVFSLTNWVVALLGFNNNALFKVLIRIAFLPFVAGLSYELLKGLAKAPNNWFINILRAPGLALQRLTTYEPKDEMAEVALKSFMTVYNMDNDVNVPEIKFGEYFYKDIRAEIIAKLSAAGVEESAEVDWILCDAIGVKRGELARISKVNSRVSRRVNEIVSRRILGEPLDYILGYSEFYGKRYIVNHNVLLPRMETEILCEKVLKVIGEKSCSVLDLCTGSGCVALTIEGNSCAEVVASDVSGEALSVAMLNATDKKVELVLSDLYTALQGRRFDIIVSNPPYIESKVIETLAIEVKNYQPLIALDGGEDGLDYYRKIIDGAPKHLNSDGKIFFEIGYDQAKKVTELLIKDFTNIEVFKDLDGNDRVVSAALKQGEL